MAPPQNERKLLGVIVDGEGPRDAFQTAARLLKYESPEAMLEDVEEYKASLYPFDKLEDVPGVGKMVLKGVAWLIILKWKPDKP